MTVGGEGVLSASGTWRGASMGEGGGIRLSRYAWTMSMWRQHVEVVVTVVKSDSSMIIGESALSDMEAS
ncbi:hypothetical protein GYH30_051667 [Glycine max]|nr:hypothetical protein GYH30_051667 [Glycine max]